MAALVLLARPARARTVEAGVRERVGPGRFGVGRRLLVDLDTGVAVHRGGRVLQATTALPTVQALGHDGGAARGLGRGLDRLGLAARLDRDLLRLLGGGRVDLEL